MCGTWPVLLSLLFELHLEQYVERVMDPCDVGPICRLLGPSIDLFAGIPTANPIQFSTNMHGLIIRHANIRVVEPTWVGVWSGMDLCRDHPALECDPGNHPRIPEGLSRRRMAARAVPPMGYLRSCS